MTARDPIFALLAAEDRASKLMDDAPFGPAAEKAHAKWVHARDAVEECVPTTSAGMVALALYTLPFPESELGDECHEFLLIRNIARGLQDASAPRSSEAEPPNPAA